MRSRVDGARTAQPVHNARPSERHDMPFRDCASIVCLTDDYEGGESYFPRLDLLLKPSKGMPVAYSVGWHHDNGVTRVLRGDRLTAFDVAHRERAVDQVSSLIG